MSENEVELANQIPKYDKFLHIDKFETKFRISTDIKTIRSCYTEVDEYDDATNSSFDKPYINGNIDDYETSIADSTNETPIPKRIYRKLEFFSEKLRLYA